MDGLCHLCTHATIRRVVSDGQVARRRAGGEAPGRRGARQASGAAPDRLINGALPSLPDRRCGTQWQG
jgi:hypothetical protein